MTDEIMPTAHAGDMPVSEALLHFGAVDTPPQERHRALIRLDHCKGLAETGG